jgi:UDP-N-acetylglucosamine 4-epimerase
VQANILSLFTVNKEAVNQVYNIACGHQTSLLELFEGLKKEAGSSLQAIHGPERTGDVKHSLADISKAIRLLGYEVKVSATAGLGLTYKWYNEQQHTK